jgi:hypothetical protein
VKARGHSQDGIAERALLPQERTGELQASELDRASRGWRGREQTAKAQACSQTQKHALQAAELDDDSLFLDSQAGAA